MGRGGAERSCDIQGGFVQATPMWGGGRDRKTKMFLHNLRNKTFSIHMYFYMFSPPGFQIFCGFFLSGDYCDEDNGGGEAG